MAINFNPARPVQLATGSGSAMATEYPHGLTAGDTVLITGAEEISIHRLEQHMIQSLACLQSHKMDMDSK